MKVEVSVGEVIDKLSILDIKLAKIQSPEKREQIQTEIQSLQEGKELVKAFPQSFWYTLLVYVNTQIWELTDEVKTLSWKDTPERFAKISNEIFELNQQRFRLKNRFNKLSSGLQEQKSYAETICQIAVNNLDTFYSSLGMINKASLEFDRVEIYTPFDKQVKKIYSSYPFTVIQTNDYPPTSILLEGNTIVVYDFPPIPYLAGGRLGDFVLSLSICNEMFLSTGRRAHIFASNNGDKFQLGIQQMIQDMLPILNEQSYFFKIEEYTNQTYSIDLTLWRNSPLLFKGNWRTIYNMIYKLPWGQSPWIRVKGDSSLSDTIFIHCSKKYLCKDISPVLKEFPNCVFISQDKDTYTAFIQKYNCPSVPFKQVDTFYQLCQCIQSCKLFICNLTMQYAVANAMHKKSYCLLSGILDDIHNSGMANLWSFTRFYTTPKHFNISVSSLDSFYRNLARINKCIQESHTVQFITPFEKEVKLIYPSVCVLNQTNEITTPLEALPEADKKYDFPTVSYYGNSRLGDVLLGLSVCAEKFYTTGRKAKVYIDGDNFKYPIQKTYEDTYTVFSNQVWMDTYSIYNGEPIDFYFNDVGKSPFMNTGSWHESYKSVFGVEWGSHPWIVVPKVEQFKDIILIHSSRTRHNTKVNLNEFIKANSSSQFIFVSDTDDEYIDFIQRTGCQIPFYKAKSFTDLAIAINSCKIFMGNLSMPNALADALHKERITMLCGWPDDKRNINMGHIWPMQQHLFN
jgi:hypothetical protein